MRDWFLFGYNGNYYRCVALPFGWGLSPCWFTQVMSPFTRELRAYGFRVLAYIDDFLVAPSAFGTTATAEDCGAAKGRIEALMSRLGIRRYESKGE